MRWCRPDRYYKHKWRGTFSHDGGALSNQGIHHIDLLRFLCGEVTKAFLMKTLGANIEVEDTAVGTFEFAKEELELLRLQLLQGQTILKLH